jgi:heme-degrading monooxygenase HmoA
MNRPALVVQVKFKSKLSLDEVMDVIHSRADDFRALPGLQQKYYLLDEATGEYGGLYFWDSAEAFSDYRDSALRSTIAAAYETMGEPRVEVNRVIMLLR